MFRIIFLILLFSFYNKAFASAWLLKAKQKTNISSFDYQKSYEFYDLEKRKQKISPFKAITYTNLNEFGLTNYLTLGSKITGKYISWLSPIYGKLNYYSVGDTEIFARIKAFETKDGIVSIQPLVKLPPPNLNAAKKQVISNGKNEYEMRLLYGVNLNKDFFFNSEVAFVDVAKSKSQAIDTDLTLGFKVNDKRQVHFKAFNKSAISKNNFDTVNFTDDFSYLKAQVSLVQEYKKSQFEVGVYQTLNGENTSKQTGVIFSIWRGF